MKYLINIVMITVLILLYMNIKSINQRLSDEVKLREELAVNTVGSVSILIEAVKYNYKLIDGSRIERQRLRIADEHLIQYIVEIDPEAIERATNETQKESAKSN